MVHITDTSTKSG